MRLRYATICVLVIIHFAGFILIDTADSDDQAVYHSCFGSISLFCGNFIWPGRKNTGYGKNGRWHTSTRRNCIDRRHDKQHHHGQKRRLNVSSIIVHSPEILLLDEPFIGQDMEGREFIRETVSETVEHGGSALIITHDPVFVYSYCDRAIFMENGTILLDGPPASVFERLKSIDYKEYADLGVQP